MTVITKYPPQPPPHVVLDAANFPRIHANTQPLSGRDRFARIYPNGLPQVYKMMAPKSESDPPQIYVEDYLPIGFYTKPPPSARAVFSTGNGKRPFREMKHILPARRIHLWDKDELQSVCNSIRKTYWEHMGAMTQPYCWDDLWTYFDAFDLYHYGALNLWNVINQLFHENVIIFSDVERESANLIGQWADSWIQLAENQRKLKEWADKRDSSIVFLLSHEDRRKMGDIPDNLIPLVASALKTRRALLLAGADNFRKKRDGPNDVLSACKNRSFQNWLAGEQVFEHNALPSPPVAAEHHCSPSSKNKPAPDRKSVV